MQFLTRRDMLRLFALPAAHLIAQETGPGPREGMATRHVKAAPRGKPSGLPFHCRLSDVSSAAGLNHVSVSGHVTRADYVIEAMGCGCAFLDYDNDGWLDILVLSSSRFGDPPPNASNRLYKNNRDGTFTDVTDEGRARSGQVTALALLWATTITMVSKTCSSLAIGTKHSLSEQRKRNLHRRHRGSRPAERQPALRLRVHVCRLRSRWQSWIFSFRITCFSIRNSVPRAKRIDGSAIPKRVFCGPRGLPSGVILFTATMATARSRMSRSPSGVSKPRRRLRTDSRRRRF